MNRPQQGLLPSQNNKNKGLSHKIEINKTSKAVKNRFDQEFQLRLFEDTLIILFYIL